MIGENISVLGRVVRYSDRIGAKMFPNAQRIGAQIAHSGLKPAAPIIAPFHPVQIEKIDLPTVFAMEAASGSPAAANGHNGQTVMMSRRPSLVSRAVNLGMKVAGAGLALYALPFAPVTAAGFYFFTLPLTAAGLGLIYKSLSKPHQEMIATYLKGLMQANAALPKISKLGIYFSHAASIAFSLSHPIGFAALLASVCSHLFALKMMKNKKELENAPLDEKIAATRDLATLGQLVNQARTLAVLDNADPRIAQDKDGYLRTLKLCYHQLEIQATYLEGTAYTGLRDDILQTCMDIANKVDELSPRQGG